MRMRFRSGSCLRLLSNNWRVYAHKTYCVSIQRCTNPFRAAARRLLGEAAFQGQDRLRHLSESAHTNIHIILWYLRPAQYALFVYHCAIIEIYFNYFEVLVNCANDELRTKSLRGEEAGLGWGC